ncbi:MAG: hypothetical protein P4M00_00260 [Azospirillaceae bacterium]|nr:hypothetical protein [Azospirillaceae bacterium]
MDQLVSAQAEIEPTVAPTLTTRIRAGRSAFLDGLLRPSLVAVFVALALCLGVMIAAATLITEQAMMAQGAALFAQDPLDDYAFASSEALRFQRQPPVGAHVALIGTAALREGLTVGGDIAARLAQRLGHPMPVVDFMSGGQSGIETAALAESLGPDFRGILVLGISLSRLAADSSELGGLVREPRLAFVSAAGDAEIRANGFEPPHRTGNYLIDNYKFFVARYRPILWHLLSGTAPVHDTRTYLGRPAADTAEWASDALILKARLSHYQERAEGNLGSLDRLIRLFPDRNKVQIVLMEIPLNPRAMDQVIGRAFVEAHRARVQAFARREGVVYWDLNPTAGLLPADFQDWAHINSAHAQDRWTSQMVERLIPLIQNP